MIAAVVYAVLISALAMIFGGSSVVDAALAEASTVRVNYYKNLYDPRRSIEGHSLALFANLNASSALLSSSSSCINISEGSALFSTDDGHYNCPERERGVVGRTGSGAQVKPLVTAKSVGRSKRNASLTDGLTISVGRETNNNGLNYSANAHRMSQDGQKAADEQGKRRFFDRGCRFVQK